MKNRIGIIVKKIKQWLCNNRRLFKHLGLGVLIIVCIVMVAATGYYFYLQNKCPKEIVLEDAYYDITSLDIKFSDRDISGTYDTNNAVSITISDNIINATSNDNITVENQTITIKSSGTYILSGELNEGMLIVAADSEDKVQLVFENFCLSNWINPAVYIKSADKVFITTAEGTVNTISDGTEYTYTDDNSNVDAAIFSKSDLALNGSGKLIVKGNTAHGIVSKDDLVIGSGKYEITSVKKALNGKDCIKIFDCEMSLYSGTDGICSNNTEDAERGYIYIKGGTINIVCRNDGVQAENVLVLEDPTINIIAGGGSVNAPKKQSNKAKDRHEDDATQEEESTESRKGLKSAKDIIIFDGAYTIDSYDDSVHADHSINIADGEFHIQSGDDGIHAEHTLLISNGNIEIEKCFEGLEGFQIAVNGGRISVIASDDGVNATSSDTVMSQIKGFFARQTLGKLEITDGLLTVNSEGDSLDSNGIMTISGGVVLVAGPQGDSNDSIVDCDGSKTVNGGILLCIGTQDDGDFGSSEDYFDVENQVQVVKSVEMQSEGTAIELQDTNGNIIVTFIAPKSFDYIVATAPNLNSESDYMFLLNGQKMTE